VLVGRGHPEPAEAVAVQLQLERAFAELLQRPALVEEVVEPAPIGHVAELHPHDAGFSAQVVRGDHGPALVITSVREHARHVRPQDLPRPPAELGGLAAPADQPLHPAQQRLGVATLVRDVDRERREPSLGHRPAQLRRAGLREPAVLLVGPLHRGAHAHPPGDVEVLAHPDLLAVEQHRRPRQREEQAVRHPDPRRAAVQTPRESPPQPSTE